MTDNREQFTQSDMQRAWTHGHDAATERIMRLAIDTRAQGIALAWDDEADAAANLFNQSKGMVMAVASLTGRDVETLMQRVGERAHAKYEETRVR